jgi:phage-related protein
MLSQTTDIYTGLMNNSEDLANNIDDSTSNWEKVAQWFEDLKKAIQKIAQTILDNIKNFLLPIVEAIQNFITEFYNTIVDIANSIGEFFAKIWNDIGGAFYKFLNLIAKGLRALGVKIPEPAAPESIDWTPI